MEKYYSFFTLAHSPPEKEAVWWLSTSLPYPGTFSGLPVPAHYEEPNHKQE